MRRLLILPMIALSACIGISYTCGPKQSRTGVRIGAGPWGVVIFGIQTDLTRLRNDIPARRAQLHPIPCGTKTCYSRDEVREAIAKIRRDAQAAFPDVALASRITLDEELERVLEYPLAFPGSKSSISLVRNGQDSSAHLVRAQEVDAAFKRAQKPIDTLLAHKQLNPTLRIRSKPDGAEFRMQIGTNESTSRDTWTQAEIESVWRGRYTGTIRKNGYRPVDRFTIDLFHGRGTTVRCTLVRETAPPNDVSICRLEK